MMDLSTRYLGLDLAHPFMPGASPLDEDLDMVLRLEDGGAAAIVMHSSYSYSLAAIRPAGRLPCGEALTTAAHQAVTDVRHVNGRIP